MTRISTDSTYSNIHYKEITMLIPVLTIHQHLVSTGNLQYLDRHKTSHTKWN